ncbi:adenylate/guanylate cyclase domain-containing protein [Mycobacteroides chelonae]|uniref:adenylate/guanylate cyclase domain-containing protein n=1 Tax=Mycobacteroides chelonae TaxID=1774 RepID=UPI001C2CA30A|nr:adenylate/guanylate cyclase domain-containing protein [Mycobacteroides chelonae]MBV0917336.1 adenylate/guanylate cyclase domain-containing protein [Mycobacteroides chelonae]
MANESIRAVSQRVGRALATITGQTGRLEAGDGYGSWLLGRYGESTLIQRIRIQLMLTVFVVAANLIGVAVVILLVLVAVPDPNVFDAPWWIHFVVVPVYVTLAVLIGAVWGTRRIFKVVRWALDEREPTKADQRNAFAVPRRLTVVEAILWAGGTALFTTLYGLQNPLYIPKIFFAVGFSGVVVCAANYLFTEFAMRPVAARALEAGYRRRRLASGIMVRTMLAWVLGSGVPAVGIMLAGVGALIFGNFTVNQLAVAVIIIAAAIPTFGLILIWISSWMLATPVKEVQSALKRVEQNDLDVNLVVYDGTELGELQAGFNTMAEGLRERERVRDLFGKHVGREVAAAAELQQPALGGEERHVAVLFADIVGSTQLAATRPAIEVVALLNRFFTVVVEEIDRYEGMVNKFEGDATLAVFGAPVRQDRPESQALAAARAIARRLRAEVPECQAGIGVASGQAVAGNVGAHDRFEYTVIGDPVNEAARLCELSKTVPGHLVASLDTVLRAHHREALHWRSGDTVTLRGRAEPTELAVPVA